MKRLALAMVLIATLGLTACGQTKTEENTSDKVDEIIEESASVEEEVLNGYMASQAGPYGELSLWIPEGWEAECISIGNEKVADNQYGLRVYRPDVNSDGVFILVDHNFGVCGTGLEEKELTIAGCKTDVGYYDGKDNWTFAAFRDNLDGVVATSCLFDEESQKAYEGFFDILDSLKLDPDRACGGLAYFQMDSEAVDIGIELRAKNISATGATLVFTQWNMEVPSGELSFGHEFSMEKLNDKNEWTALDTVCGDYGFEDEAMIITPENTTEYEFSWEWLYGALEPGTYRIIKHVNDWRAPGDYDSYELKAYFIWAGEAELPEGL